MQPTVLQLLGTFLLATAEFPQGVRMGRKAQAFLTVVAAHGVQGISRSQLLVLLWDRHSEEDARNALRQTLHQVRQAMGANSDVLTTRGDRVCLSVDREAVDLWRFEHLAKQTESGEMGLAAQLYRGDFAQGLEVGGIDIQRWIGHTQERVREVAQNLLMRMATRGEAECFDAGLDLGRRLLTSDPSHEGCYRALMLLYSRMGLASKALRIWDECRQVLRKDLNVAPSAETAALAEKLRLTLPVVSPPSSTHSIDSLLSDTMANTASRENAFPRNNDGLGYDHLLRGWQLFSQYTAEANPSARAAFEAVVHNEPDNAEALALVGWTHFFDFLTGWSVDFEQSLHQAEVCARDAIELNRGHSGPHNLLGKVLLWQKRHDAALEEVQRAVQLAPGSAYAYFHLADVLTWFGQLDQALIHIRHALQLDPNDHGIFLSIEGLTHYLLGDREAAQRSLAKAITRNPAYPWPFVSLAVLHAESGELAQARQAADQARRLNRRLSVDFAQRVLPIRFDQDRTRTVSTWRLAGFPEFAE